MCASSGEQSAEPGIGWWWYSLMLGLVLGSVLGSGSSAACRALYDVCICESGSTYTVYIVIVTCTEYLDVLRHGLGCEIAGADKGSRSI